MILRIRRTEAVSVTARHPVESARRPEGESQCGHCRPAPGNDVSIKEQEESVSGDGGEKR